MVHSFDSRMLMSALLLCCVIGQVASSQDYTFSDRILCPLSLLKLSTKCYFKFVGRRSTDRPTAWRLCKADGGILVGIENADVQNVLFDNMKVLQATNLLSGDVCGGALWTSGGWMVYGDNIYPSNKSSEWLWDSNSARSNFSAYTHWAYPPVPGKGNCLAMKMSNGEWIQHYCVEYACFICEYKDYVIADAFEPQCPVSLQKSHEICKYKFVYNNPMDWESARRYCNAGGGDLAAVENQDVRELFASSIRKADLSSSTHTMCQRYLWTSGRSVSPTNQWMWQSVNQPINDDFKLQSGVRVPGTCIATYLLPNFDSWGTINCSMSLCFVCEYKKPYVNPVSVTVSVTPTEQPGNTTNRSTDATTTPAGLQKKSLDSGAAASTLSFRCLLPTIILMMMVLAAI